MKAPSSYRHAAVPCRRARALPTSGCGSGVIAAGPRDGAGYRPPDLIDHDSGDSLAAKENVLTGRAILASSLSAAAGLWDAIVSNPPLACHGIAESHTALTQL